MADQPTLELIEHPLSPYAQKLKIAMREKGLAFTVSTPQAIGSGRGESAFMRASPRGEVPVLVVDGAPIFDSTVILEFIEDRFPENPLRPADPMARARARMIEDIADTQYEAINWGLSEILYFRRAVGALAETLKAQAADQTARLNAWLDRELGGGPWFGGESFGWADVSVLPFVQGALGFGNGPTAGTALSAWLDRARARPSVSQTFDEARDAVVAMSQVAKVVDAGGFKRQYRDHRLEWMVKSGGLEVVVAGLAADNVRFLGEPA